MRNALAIMAAAFSLLTPDVGAAKGRGPALGFDGRGEVGILRAAASEQRGPPPERGRPAPSPQPRARGVSRAPPSGLSPGQLLPPTYRGAPIQDLDRRRLRTPPPGYDWVQVGRDVYLMQRSTGMVLEAIPGGY